MPQPILARAAPWLRSEALSALETHARSFAAAEPRRWNARLAFHGRTRFLRLGAHSLRAVGTARDVTVVHPILDNRFVSALATRGGAAGLGDRTSVMRTLFGSALPEVVLQRRVKAEFGHALWRSKSRAFAEEWDGTGVDLQLIDPGRLREAWRAPNPLFGSMLPLHATWLASQAS